MVASPCFVSPLLWFHCSLRFCLLSWISFLFSSQISGKMIGTLWVRIRILMPSQSKDTILQQSRHHVVATCVPSWAALLSHLRPMLGYAGPHLRKRLKQTKKHLNNLHTIGEKTSPKLFIETPFRCLLEPILASKQNKLDSGWRPRAPRWIKNGARMTILNST